MKCMIDIETLGTEAGCVVLSIGAVKFDEDGVYEEFYRNIDIESCQSYGLGIEAGTLKWWFQQDEEAMTELTEGNVPLDKAMKDLRIFYGHNCEEVWAKPPSFDCIILEKAFEFVGVKVPWHHTNRHNLRTAKLLSDARPEEDEDLVEHNALDDAKQQARVAVAILNDL